MGLGRWLGAALVLSSCGTADEASWTFTFESADDRERAAIVEATIARGSCEAPGEVVYRDEIGVGDRGRATDRLEAGPHAFMGVAVDAECSRIAEGCRTVELPVPAGHALDVVLRSIAHTSICTAAEACVEGACVASDGGTTVRPDVVDVAASGRVTCVLRDSGAVACWGDNGFGQLGVGSTERREGPVEVAGLSDVRSLAVGPSHVCAVQSAGQVMCWGRNEIGQLGDGTRSHRYAPVRAAVVEGEEVAELALGDRHTCARLADGRALCWGANDDGQLGDGTSDDRWLEAVDPGLSGVTKIAAGAMHTCAVHAGTVACWGNNTNGQIGNGMRSGNVVRPTDIAGLTDVLDIVAAGSVTCARQPTSTVCWGANGDQQIESSIRDELTSPRDVDLGPGDAAVTGGTHVCVLRGDQLRCRGRNATGELGVGTTAVAPGVSMPEVAATDVAAGSAHTCALRTDGHVACWGHDDAGQLGRGVDIHALSPVEVRGLANASSVAAGSWHTCALSEGGVVCWGRGDLGQLGIASAPAVEPMVRSVTLLADVSAIGAYASHTCAAHAGGVACWGADSAAQSSARTGSRARLEPFEVSALPAIAVAPGGLHSCVARSGGTVDCWGDNSEGQAGLPPDMPALALAVSEVAGAAGIVDVTSGSRFTCARADDGGVWCWGENGAGQLGDGTTTRRHTPRAVSPLGSASALDAGAAFACAVVGGGVDCWGDNSEGQLGNGGLVGSAVPARVSLPSPATDVSAGHAHACALLSDQTVRCWGRNDNGELGIGSRSGPRTEPVPVPGLEDVVAIGAGGNHTCAVRAPGSTPAVWCWGNNAYGQLASGVVPFVAAPPADGVVLP